MSIRCRACGSDLHVKNGFVYGVQRYRCKGCSANFLEKDRRIKYGIEDRLKVIKLYLENSNVRKIERLTGIRNSQISKWIMEIGSYIKRELRRNESKINSIKDISILEIDDLCAYIKKGKKMEVNSSFCGLLLTGNQIKLLTVK